jgi:hypothetical protein
MICSWSLAYDVLNGTLDENFPIMNNFKSAEEGAEWVKKNGGYEYTPTPDPNDHNDPRNYPPYVYETPDGGKTVTRRRAGSLNKEVIQGDFYTSSKVTEVNSESAFNDFMNSKKPEPNLKYNPRKYEEDKSIEALKNYVSSTYSGHYTSDQNNTQTLDLIQSVGDAESFCRSNAIKYLARYDKKGQAKQDILKAMHYCLLLYYFSGQTNETPTRGYETF